MWIMHKIGSVFAIDLNPMISIIIPAYNEEDSLSRLLEYLNVHCEKSETEILVVDGGSEDETRAVASKLGATVCKGAEKGRSKQMNWGARHAKGDILYFLHADTFPPASFVDDIKDAVKKGFAAGCFRLSFDVRHPLLAFYAWFTRFDVNFFRFGDQSLFVEKSTWEKVGGFDESLIVMEDQVIVPLLKKEASFKIMKKNVVTSARKYIHVGIIKLQLVFTVIVLLFYAGVDHKKIVNFYRRQI